VVGLSILGAVLAYSPVPYGDMWDGALDFMVRAAQGSPLDWWGQHNEHRILLSRLLFFLDMQCCRGANWPLVVANYLFAGAASLVFLRMLRDSMGTQSPAGRGELVLGLCLTAWLFQWMQQENLTWAFQSQFFLAQLLPLCAFYCCGRSTGPPASGRWFLAACALGAASAATMANGLLALPLMALHAWMTRQDPRRILALAALGAAAAVLYFHGYQSPPRHGSVWQSATHDPLGMLAFALLYVGSPFYHLVGGGSIGTAVAGCCGLLLTVFLVRDAVAALRQANRAAAWPAIITYIAYVGITALATAGGRLVFGIDQAVSSRYTTPALMAWAALAVLHAPSLAAALEAGRQRILVPFYSLAALMLVGQLQALEVPREELFEHRIAALALELQIEEPGQIRWVFPDTRQALAIALKASDLGLSVFGQYPLAGVRQLMSATVEPANLPPCQGKLDALLVAKVQPRLIQVSGWMYDEATGLAPQVIRFIAADGRLIGYALTGGERADLPKEISQHGNRAGFRGYLLPDGAQAPLELRGERPGCRKTIAAPALVLANEPALCAACGPYVTLATR
jgi:hypothetical protein